MSVNRYQPHVYVLPEDDANRQIANGFELELPNRQFQMLPKVGGWMDVMDRFQSVHVADMERFPDTLMVLLIDFDNHLEPRWRDVKRCIPDRLTDRVFILGALSRPERLRNSLGSYESIGKSIAKDCRERTDITWGRHELLQHNATEFDRLRDRVHAILFPAV